MIHGLADVGLVVHLLVPVDSLFDFSWICVVFCVKVRIVDLLVKVVLGTVAVKVEDSEEQGKGDLLYRLVRVGEQVAAELGNINKFFRVQKCSEMRDKLEVVAS